MTEEKIKLFDSEEAMNKALPVNTIKNIKIGITRYSAVVIHGKLHFMEYGCPHMGYPLFQAVATPYNEITCPWHNYRFSLETGLEIQQRCRPLRRYPVEINSQGVFVLIP